MIIIIFKVCYVFDLFVTVIILSVIYFVTLMCVKTDLLLILMSVQMAGQCLVGLVLAFFLSAGRSLADVDQNWLTGIVEGIKNGWVPVEGFMEVRQGSQIRSHTRQEVPWDQTQFSFLDNNFDYTDFYWESLQYSRRQEACLCCWVDTK